MTQGDKPSAGSWHTITGDAAFRSVVAAA